jgi:hypothetical protein
LNLNVSMVEPLGSVRRTKCFVAATPLAAQMCRTTTLGSPGRYLCGWSAISPPDTPGVGSFQSKRES